MRVVSRQPVDNRRSVVLIEAYGRFLLLGVAEGSITLITELSAAEVSEAERRLGSTPTRSFAQVLRDTLKRSPSAPEPILPREPGGTEPRRGSDAKPGEGDGA